MLQIAPQMRILVAIEPVDLRKGIDGLAELCREKLSAILSPAACLYSEADEPRRSNFCNMTTRALFWRKSACQMPFCLVAQRQRAGALTGSLSSAVTRGGR